MAKLSAHGRELFRFERIRPADADGVEHRITHSLRSDGTVLAKREWRYATPRTLGSTWDTRWHGTGFRIHTRNVQNMDVWVAEYRRQSQTWRELPAGLH